MHQILCPKKVLPIQSLEIPSVFFAGPVRGGDDWQAAAFIKLSGLLPKFCAAIPIPADANRLGKLAYDRNHPLARYFIGSDTSRFQRQLDWERYHIERATIQGCLIFWLPTESTEHPRPDGYFGRDTMGELGEWRGRLIEDLWREAGTRKKYRIVIGGESGFPGFDTIKRNFTLALGDQFPFYSTLDETVAAAVRLIQKL